MFSSLPFLSMWSKSQSAAILDWLLSQEIMRVGAIASAWRKQKILQRAAGLEAVQSGLHLEHAPGIHTRIVLSLYLTFESYILFSFSYHVPGYISNIYLTIERYIDFVFRQDCEAYIAYKSREISFFPWLTIGGSTSMATLLKLYIIWFSDPITQIIENSIH